MKLFIINRSQFTNTFQAGHDRRPDVYSSPRQIHINAFNEMVESVKDGYIPIQILAEYKDFGFAIFEFVSVKNDVYYYKYITTAS